MAASVTGNSTTYTTSYTYTQPTTINVTDVILAGVTGGSDAFVLGDGTKINTWLKQIEEIQNAMAQILKTQDTTYKIVDGYLGL